LGVGLGVLAPTPQPPIPNPQLKKLLTFIRYKNLKLKNILII